MKSWSRALGVQMIPQKQLLHSFMRMHLPKGATKFRSSYLERLYP